MTGQIGAAAIGAVPGASATQPFTLEHVTSADGTVIAYRRLGTGRGS
jgi:hypothetical protein